MNILDYPLAAARAEAMSLDYQTLTKFADKFLYDKEYDIIELEMIELISGFRSIVFKQFQDEIRKILPASVNFQLLEEHLQKAMIALEEFFIKADENGVVVMDSSNEKFVADYVSQLVAPKLRGILLNAGVCDNRSELNIAMGRISFEASMKMLKSFSNLPFDQNTDFDKENIIQTIVMLHRNVLEDTWGADAMETSADIIDFNDLDDDSIENEIRANGAIFLLIHAIWQYLQIFRAVISKKTDRIDPRVGRSGSVNPILSATDLVDARISQFPGHITINNSPIQKGSLIAMADYYKDRIQLEKFNFIFSDVLETFVPLYKMMSVELKADSEKVYELLDREVEFFRLKNTDPFGKSKFTDEEIIIQNNKIIKFKELLKNEAFLKFTIESY